MVAAPVRAANAPNPMPPSSIVRRTLANGASIIVRRDSSAPLVAVDLWIRAGAADDGGTGAAHALEHMLFKGSREAPTERVDAAVEATGAVLSASTLSDATHFWASVPPNQLKTVLTNLAKVVREPALEPVAWERERKVIAEEIERSKTDLAAEARRTLSFKLFGPRGAPVSGTTESLKALTPDAIRSFHAANYRADRMVLVVAGNVDPSATIRAAEAVLATLPKPQGSQPLGAPATARPGPHEAVAEASGRVAIGVGFAAPGGETAALDVACAVLRRKLERALAGIADGITVAHPWQRAGMVAIVAEGAATDRDRILASLRTTALALGGTMTEYEVHQSVRSARWRWWLDHESPVSQTRALGMAATFGDLNEATLASERMGFLTVEDVRAAARRTFVQATPSRPAGASQ